jgi:ubiquinone/menaquinone biosynthesis C-methylase UbiE
MDTNLLIEKNYINEMSYADFLAFIKYENTPPGSIGTISKWIRKGKLSKNSKLLEIACNTGFSSRAINNYLGCEIHGFDISEKAISEARNLVNKLKNNIHFSVGDAHDMPYENSIFTHIIAGCTFGFFDDMRKVLEECYRVLKPGGIICVSNFYYHRNPPDSLVFEVNKLVDIPNKNRMTLASWDRLYGDQFSLIYRSNCISPPDCPKEIQGCIDDFFEKEFPDSKFTSTERDSAYNRLLQTRLLLNKVKNYHGVCVDLWKKK